MFDSVFLIRAGTFRGNGRKADILKLETSNVTANYRVLNFAEEDKTLGWFSV